MANEDRNSEEDNDRQKKKEGGPAAINDISLSQAILAPLDALFKAQVHAARSFLNLLLQIGYPHQSVQETGTAASGEQADGQAYNLEFFHNITIDNETRKQRISVPALALIPLAPLAVESGEFSFDMTISKIEHHQQIQASEKSAVDTEKGGYNRSKRPWYLVDDPVSIHGNIAPLSAPPPGEREVEPAQRVEGEQAQKAKIHVEVKVGKVPLPAGLDKLITSLTQISSMSDVGDGTEGES